VALNPEIRTVVVTAYGTVEGAVACLKDGACDYLLKPLDLDEVEQVARRALEERHLRRENRELRRRLGEIESVPGIVTAGGPMAEVLSAVARVARSSVSVLLLGESGTGKELVARAIHAASARAARPFVAVSAAALSPTLLESELFGHERGAFTGADRARVGRFEAASGGTLFLDEIGDLPAEVQVKLLRVLQERTIERLGSNRPVPVDVRFLSATHRDLAAEVASGRFREDLYYRLAVVTIELPPLRRRRSDIPLLVEHFVEKHAAAAGGTARALSREAMDVLMAYAFPGNVRELENVVQRCMVMARGSLITVDDLPSTLREAARGEGDPDDPGATLPERIAALERRAIDRALAAEQGNQTRAALRLGISERALRYKLAKLRERRHDSSNAVPRGDESDA
ncbi:MAG TPA: sigma-54 dependent transcriptional regulator, partial [Thermoanaerobaculia bacterium]|nr:sigma-54 dependent transcriptional regulator [Thermoanaerobaculia bacterium]